MTFTHPLLNAIFAALLGILLVLRWVWDNPREHTWLITIVATLCAILGYAYGEPFLRFLLPRGVW